MAVIFLVSLVTLQSSNVNAQTKTITVPDNYPTIQAAIDAAASGDTIIVKDGVYPEQTININKPMFVTSENVGGANLELNPPKSLENLFGVSITVYANSIAIKADNVEFSGFRIISDGGDVNATGNLFRFFNNVVKS